MHNSVYRQDRRVRLPGVAHYNSRNRLIGWLAGRLAAIVRIVELLLLQPFQLGPRPGNHGGDKTPRRILTFLRQLLDSQVEKRNVVLEPAQRTLHLGNTKFVAQHCLPPVHQLAQKHGTAQVHRKIPAMELGGWDYGREPDSASRSLVPGNSSSIRSSSHCSSCFCRLLGMS